MRGPGYPAGVPTPYAMHVSPYPTRFHGGIWSRPEFDFPVAPTPSTVFLPPRDIEMIPDKPYSGLGSAGPAAAAEAGGTARYNVGEGIFRPGGYGGGVFDGNLSGAPALGQRKARSLRGLGDFSHPSPDPVNDPANFPYGQYSAQTMQMQNALNSKLIANGFCPLIADGKLGPATCGAAQTIGGLSPGSAVLWPSTCQDFTAPKLSSGGCGTGPSAPTPVKSPTTAASPAVSLPMVSSTTKKVLGFVAGGLAAVGVVYYVKKRRR